MPFAQTKELLATSHFRARDSASLRRTTLLRQCDFAKASEYMSGVLMGMIAGVTRGHSGDS
jgi:hypothetical protein